MRAALLEGGPTLAGAFLGAGLVDQVVGYVAPKVLGAGPAALAGAGIATIAEAIELELTDVAAGRARTCGSPPSRSTASEAEG